MESGDPMPETQSDATVAREAGGLAKIAIIGRPNVGKSTLFNRLVGKRLALVDDTPGVTRDRREGEARLGDLSFIVIDTPGLEEAPDAALEGRMRKQTEQAISDADACIFVIDARAGVTPLDARFGDFARASNKPVILLANKAEGPAADAGTHEAWSLGLGEPIPFSAEHAEGMADLYTALQPIVDRIAEANPQSDDDETGWDNPLKPLRVAIVGRPTAGESIFVEWRWEGPDRPWPVKLFDTAGMRKKSRVQSKLEKLSVADTIRAARFAEVVVLLIDAETPFEKQDLQIADLILREGRALVIAVNKWDLIENKDEAAKSIREKAARLLPQAPGAPVIFLSAATGRNLEKLMPAIIGVYVDWNARIKTPDLNVWLRDAVERHPPPAVSGQRIKLRFITQIKTRPPTFVAKCTRAEDVPAAYQRYLINGIRDAFDLPAVPIRLILSKPENPFADDKD